MLSSRAATTVELATVASLRVDLYTTLDQSDRAVAVCLDYLRHVASNGRRIRQKRKREANTSGSG
jgi:hypothetical protein